MASAPPPSPSPPPSHRASSSPPPSPGRGPGPGPARGAGSSRASAPAPPPPKPTWDPGLPARGGQVGWLRPTIRFRLTVLYGGMFLIAGILLLSLIYLLVAQSLRATSELPFRPVPGSTVEITSGVCSQYAGGTVDTADFQRCMEHFMAVQRQEALDSLLKRSLIALLGLTLAAFAFGYVMAGRVLQPLGRITRMARSVAGSDLHRRIELDGPDDELKELADTFDDMLDRLDRAFDAQRRFVANASHELRTPLAINRTLLEVQLSDPDASADLQQLGRTLLATNERSEQLVEGLLLLARSENEVTDRRPVDLAEAATQALEQTRAEAAGKGVELRHDLRSAVVQGNGVLLERIALNLVQNAVRYNTPDGRVTVTTEALPGQAVLVVSNTGPVVPGYELDTIFEPFRRLRTERTGSDKGVGLGLSIVRSVVRAHGGAITARPREGGGLEMRVSIPD